jgi:lysophospholipid acyltransferase (LPLAT)-like uncharacterized protein
MNSSSTKPQRNTHEPRFSFAEELKIRCWSWLAFLVLWVLGATTRKQRLGGDELLDRWQRGEQVILAFWHGRILLMSFAYRGQKACVMNSVHRDGEIITRVLQRFGVNAVRGSSTRGWMSGLKGMLDAYQQGHDLLVVPDGPRGPCYQAKSGVIQLARATGAPIFPAAYSAAWKTTVGSWDRLLIPFPFSRVLYVVGEPIYVPREATNEEIEAKRQELETTLVTITTQADAYFAGQPIPVGEAVTPKPFPPRSKTPGYPSTQ